ncbi:hypothetical protein SAMN02746065_11351 [Desulfocicer vacuolatum DSM 3385]|uniref:NanoRNase/pAp phosphatase, hydrolyzes c-di-AMP and oligoRNAs n=1 Tax=Desulfocicer vacuolatum DSM 3385 TaxID=1121400 RepID=A0A1W2CQV8_9BACT|nr:exopolyphosphatase [Desulfocicer vacuolatum]SMC87356.1 hypothetical protein SAMN02746065_11351 [Desulfocicer vacuolatum DSM 3385]
MRIVTRPDFDGVVCAVFLCEAEKINEPIKWVEPSQIQNSSIEIRSGDVLANLPYDPRCSLWFDHHVSNSMEKMPHGLFRIAPSAAGLVHEYYKKKGKLDKDFDELVRWTDIIDAALLEKDHVLYPEKYPYLLLSMTIKNRNGADASYWDHLVQLLRNHPIEFVMEDPQVKVRCEQVVQENRTYVDILKAHTVVKGDVSVTDFRELDIVPSGNRFSVYCIYPDIMASVKIRYHEQDRDTTIVSIGQSIFKKGLKVNIGHLLSRYGGGGHAGAGGCSMKSDFAPGNIREILTILETNVPLT